jgi:hypothetical protein
MLHPRVLGGRTPGLNGAPIPFSLDRLPAAARECGARWDGPLLCPVLKSSTLVPTRLRAAGICTAKCYSEVSVPRAFSGGLSCSGGVTSVRVSYICRA